MQHTFRFAQSCTVPTLLNNIAYPAGHIPIKIAKISDIVKLLPYILDKYREFYEEIVNWPTTAGREVDADAQDE